MINYKKRFQGATISLASMSFANTSAKYSAHLTLIIRIFMPEINTPGMSRCVPTGHVLGRARAYTTLLCPTTRRSTLHGSAKP